MLPGIRAEPAPFHGQSPLLRAIPAPIFPGPPPVGETRDHRGEAITGGRAGSWRATAALSDYRDGSPPPMPGPGERRLAHAPTPAAIATPAMTSDDGSGTMLIVRLSAWAPLPQV
jgi:hypothetical protein